MVIKFKCVLLCVLAFSIQAYIICNHTFREFRNACSNMLGVFFFFFETSKTRGKCHKNGIYHLNKNMNLYVVVHIDRMIIKKNENDSMGITYN